MLELFYVGWVGVGVRVVELGKLEVSLFDGLGGGGLFYTEDFVFVTEPVEEVEGSDHLVYKK